MSILYLFIFKQNIFVQSKVTTVIITNINGIERQADLFCSAFDRPTNTKQNIHK